MWDMTDPPLPGTPASFVGPLEPLSPQMDSEALHQDDVSQHAARQSLDSPVTPSRPLVHMHMGAAAGQQAIGSLSHLGIDVGGSSDSDDDITPPRSLASDASHDSDGLCVRTAFDPLRSLTIRTDRFDGLGLSPSAAFVLTHRSDPVDSHTDKHFLFHFRQPILDRR